MQANQWFVILNPKAGGGRAMKIWKRVRPQLEKLDLIAHVESTTHKGHATTIVKEAIEAGYRKLLTVGGDGTNNEVVNGMMQQQEVPSVELTYALLPVGTGNDWIRTHQIPKKTDAWLAMIKKGKWNIQDVGLAKLVDESKRRYFVNIAGLAYDAFVVKYMETHSRWIAHPIIFQVMILWCLFKYRLEKAVLNYDKQSVSDYFYTINVGLCRFSGGGMEICPQAQPNDQHFALTFAKSISKLGVIRNIYRFFNGTIGELPQVETTLAKEVVVETKGIGVEVDGEFVGESPVHFELIPNALKVIVT